jgi:hypothetical protein
MEIALRKVLSLFINSRSAAPHVVMTAWSELTLWSFGSARFAESWVGSSAGSSVSSEKTIKNYPRGSLGLCPRCENPASKDAVSLKRAR